MRDVDAMPLQKYSMVPLAWQQGPIMNDTDPLSPTKHTQDGTYKLS